jgi:hypothetical protein
MIPKPNEDAILSTFLAQQFPIAALTGDLIHDETLPKDRTIEVECPPSTSRRQKRAESGLRISAHE